MEQAAKSFTPATEFGPEIAGRIGPNASRSEPEAHQGAPHGGPHRGPVDGPTDGALVTRVLSGERAAFDVLINRYQRQAVAVSYRLLGNSHDALEVTQDAFLKSFNSLPTLQKPDAFGGWLMRIVSNLSLNYRRGRKTRTKAQLPLDDVLGNDGPSDAAASSEWSAKGADPSRTLESREMGAKLNEAMAALPEKQRLAIVLFTIEQMPQKDVAVALKCSVEAVKWHVFQGRKKLKEMLKEHL